ncbi:pyrroloquinoline quinone biosynthesis protein PqqE [Alsobacter soli]|uniref:PqqA peptide cyclase n=1 Tax=Alsobacter soli TaxID=2109933 RepID=A0A2T1HM46_9HYPH|nr:pyrroloquinoline quinone biosynthesis protein PqqE [Alsobacter soli]PSC02706.1 pyrroloquinoline quinone biosynthesis protein PqqE [Alsobacter soli]
MTHQPQAPSRPLAAPLGLLAELTHRCALGCPYCSNPLELEARSRELGTDEWRRVFSEAARLGVLQIHLSGGEPALRRDILDLVRHCSAEGLYTNLITSGVGYKPELIRGLADAGLDHVQLSVQDIEPGEADRIAGYRGAFAVKREIARQVIEAGLPLTINAVVHRANVDRAPDLVRMALEWGAQRVEIAHTQYYGWALTNRTLLLPPRDAALRAIAAVEALKAELQDLIAVDHVLPDYHADYPKACMGGWGRRILNVTPAGKVLPCHASEGIPGLTFWNVSEHGLAEIWQDNPAFNAYRGTGWMQEPCLSCSRREIDFGGCRCQAMMMTGDPAATDPVCKLSPHHARVAQALAEEQPAPDKNEYVYRRLTVSNSPKRTPG